MGVNGHFWQAACGECGAIPIYLIDGMCTPCLLRRKRLEAVKAAMIAGVRYDEWMDKRPYDPNRLYRGDPLVTFGLVVYPYYRHVMVEGRPAADYIRPPTDEGGEENTAA